MAWLPVIAHIARLGIIRTCWFVVPASKTWGDTPAKGYLTFEKEDGEVDWVDTITLLEGIPCSQIRLVVLSSCQSARVRGTDLLLAGVGPGLILGGVPAVVAMQFSILDSDSISFNKQFYDALLERKSFLMQFPRGA